MEQQRIFESNSQPSLPQSSASSRLLKAISFSVALALTGCSKDPCKGIPNGSPGEMPFDGEQACFLKGDLFDQERAQAFRQACSKQGGHPRRAWLKYPFGEAGNTHVCLAPDSEFAWIPEPDEDFGYNGRHLSR